MSSIERSAKVNPVDSADGLEITGFLWQSHAGEEKQVEARPQWLKKEYNVRAKAFICLIVMDGKREGLRILLSVLFCHFVCLFQNPSLSSM